MVGLEDRLTELGATFVLLLARTGGLVAAAPVLSSASTPIRVRGLVAVALAAVLTPMAMGTVDVSPGTSLDAMAGSVASEVAVGVLLGMGAAVVLAGVQATGEIVGQMSGMALTEGADPTTQDSGSVFAMVFRYAVLAVFVASGGVRELVAGLVETLRRVPPGSAASLAAMADEGLTLAAKGFEVGVRASGPLLVALFLATIVLGLVSRTLPQVNTQAVGFGLNGLLTLGLMTTTLGAVAWGFQEPLAAAIERMVDAAGPAPPP